jgi:hypothetical protein
MKDNEGYKSTIRKDKQINPAQARALVEARKLEKDILETTTNYSASGNLRNNSLFTSVSTQDRSSFRKARDIYGGKK